MNAIYLHEMRIGLRWSDSALMTLLCAYYDESGEYGQDGALIAMSMAGGKLRPRGRREAAAWVACGAPRRFDVSQSATSGLPSSGGADG